MRSKTRALIVGIIALVGVLRFAEAASDPSAATQEAGKAPIEAKKPVKKTTEVSFEDVLVQGKYHFSDEAVTTVEEDKVLDALLGVRKDFQDRIKKSAERF